MKSMSAKFPVSSQIAHNLWFSMQFSKQINIFKSNNHRKFRNSSFLDLLESNYSSFFWSLRISWCSSPTIMTWHPNKIVCLNETSSSNWKSTNVPVLTSIYLIKCTPTPIISNKNLVNFSLAHRPTYEYLKKFGSACVVFLHSVKHSKLSPKSVLRVFVGLWHWTRGILML